MYITQMFRRAAQGNAAGLATIDKTGRRTWSETSKRVERLAGGLASLDLCEGDRVAVLSLNSARVFETYFSIFWLGAVCVPLNTRWSFEELVYGLADSTPVILLVDESFAGIAPDLKARCPSVRHIVLMTPESTHDGDFVHYEKLLGASEPVEPVVVAGEALAVICYTGGTTGRSKGVMISHLGLWASAVSFSNDLRGFGCERVVTLSVLPLFHMGGVHPMLSTVLGRGCNVFLHSFDPRSVLSLIQREKITYMLLVPTMLRMVLDQPDIATFELSSLKMMGYGAAPISQAMVEETMAMFPGLQLHQGYGQTELSPYISVLLPENHVVEGPDSGKLRSVGRCGSCSEAIIADSSGRELPRGQAGELLIRGPNTMLGYWRKPDETAATLVNGWVRTGDAAYMDKDGFIFLIDRIKDMIISGGENIYSSEVENALASHPAVATGVAIGVPDQKWGEAVHAIVVLREGQNATAQEIMAHCRSLIAGYKCPRSVEFRIEPLPLSGAGKILKRELRKPYWEGRESSIV